MLKPDFGEPKMEFVCYLLLGIFWEKGHLNRMGLSENNSVAQRICRWERFLRVRKTGRNILRMN